MSKHTCPKVNIEAVRGLIHRVNPDYTVEQEDNTLVIAINNPQVDTDTVIGLSILLYGTHNSFRISRYYSKENLELNAGVYRLLPEFLIPGEEIEFELSEVWK